MPTLSSTPEDKQQIREKIGELVQQYYHRWVKYGYYGNPNDMDSDTEYNTVVEAIESLIKEALQSQLEELEEVSQQGRVFTADLNGSAMGGGYQLAMKDIQSAINEMREKL